MVLGVGLGRVSDRSDERGQGGGCGGGRHGGRTRDSDVAIARQGSGRHFHFPNSTSVQWLGGYRRAGGKGGGGGGGNNR
jgi:hypothetical protein